MHPITRRKEVEKDLEIYIFVPFYQYAAILIAFGLVKSSSYKLYGPRSKRARKAHSCNMIVTTMILGRDGQIMAAIEFPYFCSFLRYFLFGAELILCRYFHVVKESTGLVVIWDKDKTVADFLGQ